MFRRRPQAVLAWYEAQCATMEDAPSVGARGRPAPLAIRTTAERGDELEWSPTPALLARLTAAAAEVRADGAVCAATVPWSLTLSTAGIDAWLLAVAPRHQDAAASASASVSARDVSRARQALAQALQALDTQIPPRRRERLKLMLFLAWDRMLPSDASDADALDDDSDAWHPWRPYTRSLAPTHASLADMAGRSWARENAAADAVDAVPPPAPSLTDEMVELITASGSPLAARWEAWHGRWTGYYRQLQPALAHLQATFDAAEGLSSASSSAWRTALVTADMLINTRGLALGSMPSREPIHTAAVPATLADPALEALEYLVPLLDYCNHDAEHANAFWEVGVDGVRLMVKAGAVAAARAAADAHQQADAHATANARAAVDGIPLLISYGDDKSDLETVFLHGFASLPTVRCLDAATVTPMAPPLPLTGLVSALDRALTARAATQAADAKDAAPDAETRFAVLQRLGLPPVLDFMEFALSVSAVSPNAALATAAAPPRSILASGLNTDDRVRLHVMAASSEQPLVRLWEALDELDAADEAAGRVSDSSARIDVAAALFWRSDSQDNGDADDGAAVLEAALAGAVTATLHQSLHALHTAAAAVYRPSGDPTWQREAHAWLDLAEDALTTGTPARLPPFPVHALVQASRWCLDALDVADPHAFCLRSSLAWLARYAVALAALLPSADSAPNRSVNDV